MTNTLPKTFMDMFGVSHPAARFSQAVVIVIDMQREYLDGAVPLPDIAATTQATAELLQLARTHKTPVIHVVNRGPDGGLLFNADGPYYAELDDIAARHDEPVVIKHLPNSFAGTELAALIRKTGRRQLILAGCTTHVCVSATARAALDLGYQTTIVAAATTSRDLNDGFGNIVPAHIVKQTALAELHDGFSAIVNTAHDLAA